MSAFHNILSWAGLIPQPTQSIESDRALNTDNSDEDSPYSPSPYDTADDSPQTATESDEDFVVVNSEARFSTSSRTLSPRPLSPLSCTLSPRPFSPSSRTLSPDPCIPPSQNDQRRGRRVVRPSSPDTSYQGIPPCRLRGLYDSVRILWDKNPSIEDVRFLAASDLSDDIILYMMENAQPPPRQGGPPRSRRLHHQAGLPPWGSTNTSRRQFVSQVVTFRPDALVKTGDKGRILQFAQTAAQTLDGLDLQSVPDVWFPEKVNIFGKPCHWIWYGGIFVYRKHGPFKKRLRRCVELFGPGMIVYKLGFCRSTYVMKNLRRGREADVLEWFHKERCSSETGNEWRQIDL